MDVVSAAGLDEQMSISQLRSIAAGCQHPDLQMAPAQLQSCGEVVK